MFSTIKFWKTSVNSAVVLGPLSSDVQQFCPVIQTQPGTRRKLHFNQQ